MMRPAALGIDVPVSIHSGCCEPLARASGCGSARIGGFLVLGGMKADRVPACKALTPMSDVQHRSTTVGR